MKDLHEEKVEELEELEEEVEGVDEDYDEGADKSSDEPEAAPDDEPSGEEDVDEAGEDEDAYGEGDDEGDETDEGVEVDEGDQDDADGAVGSWISRHKGACGLICGLAAGAIVAGVCFGVLSGTSGPATASSGAASSSQASASSEAAAAEGSVINMRVGAEGYDIAGSSPALLRVMGVGADGLVSEFYVIAPCNADASLNLAPGSYDVSVAVAPVNPDGTTYSAGESLGFEMPGGASDGLSFALTPTGTLDVNSARSAVSKASGILNAGDVISPSGIAPSDFLAKLRANLGVVDAPSVASGADSAAAGGTAAATTGSPTSLNANSGTASSASAASASSSSAASPNSPASSPATASSSSAAAAEKHGDWKRVIVTPEVREITPILDDDGNVIGEEESIVQEAEYEVVWVES